MRVLFRLSSVLLALWLGAAGALGVWLQQTGDEGARQLQQVLNEQTRRIASERKLPPDQQTRYLKAADQVAKAMVPLGAPAAYGTLLGVSAALVLLAMFALRAPRAARGKSSPAKLSKATSRPSKAAAGKRSTAKVAPAKSKKVEAAELAGDGLEDSDSGPSGKERKKLLKTAAQLEKDDGPEAAGDYLLDAGLRDEAVEAFLRGELVGRAAEVRQDQNRFEEAAELFSKAERWETAAKVYTQLEQYDRAAQCYLSADKKSVAGEMFERAGHYRQAGDCFRDIGFGRQAAQAYLKAGADASAAEALARIFQEEGGVAAAKSDGQVKEMRAIGKKAGDLLFKLERFEEAESILSRAELWGAAAKVAFHRGNHAAAAEWFRKVGRGDLAAHALEQMGDEKGAALAMGGYLRDQGRLEEAAEYLARAEEWVEAAGAFRSLERYVEAGQCYMHAHDYGAAAEMFRAVRDFPRAAEAYARSQRPREAAECYREAGDDQRQAQMLEQAGDAFAAGCVHFEHGRAEDAIRLLQQVPETSPHFGDACAYLGKLFSERGMDSLAFKKYEQATADTAVSPGTVEAYYGLALACEKRGDPRTQELFERILAFDYQYADVNERLERWKRQNARTTLAAVPQIIPPDAVSENKSFRYDLVREIGRGGMGVVYLARDVLLERDVAYKVLPEQLRENPDALRNFLREAKAAAQLNHPNIVTVYDVGECAHGYYLAMEYVGGTTLKEIVQKRGPVAPGGLVYILRQLCEALGYAHSKKVVHRDIKTANAMWTVDKQVKIMDFGLARLLEEVRNATTTISGTPFYMSPEQTLGKSVDHRTDLYSLGVTMFELATGQLPFRRGNVPYHHVHTAPPDPRSLNAQLPDPMAEVILRCLQKAPDDRYPSAKHVVDDLAQRMKAAGDAT